LVSQVDLLAQPLLDGLSDAFVDKSPIPATRLCPRRSEFGQ